MVGETMAHWILMLARNGINFTKPAVQSCLAQTGIGKVRLLMVDNMSTDGTREYLNRLYPDVVTITNVPQKSVAESWNQGLTALFSDEDTEAVLVVNNDVELHPETYMHLLNAGDGFVTAVGVDNPGCLLNKPKPSTKSPHPDFSCYLIRRWVWDRVGRFDEHFAVAFGEDWDYHCRMQAAGVRAVSIDLPYYHYGSATIKALAPEAAEAMGKQADANREYFAKKWGFKGASPEYERFFSVP
jgi:GT2 family glycosyltransferase